MRCLSIYMGLDSPVEYPTQKKKTLKGFDFM